jgi:two-component system cell cycle response regulator
VDRALRQESDAAAPNLERDVDAQSCVVAARRGADVVASQVHDVGTGLRILVADADPGTRALLRLAVRTEGGRPVEAEDGVSALAILYAGIVDMALIDLRLPGLTGEQVLANAGESLRDVPVLALTEVERSRAMVGLRAGAHDYIPKPFEPLELSTRIRAAARVRAAMKAGTARRQHLLDQLTSLERAAFTDELTGVGNRRLLRRALDTASHRASREGLPYSVVVVDVDNFKSVNDALGHDVGDAVLQRVAVELARALRADDTAGRWGGDEFMAVLPATTTDAAVAAVGRVRAGIASAPLPVRVTITIGIATGLGPADEVLREADQALLEGKRAGRDCVRFAAGTTVGDALTTSVTRMSP